MKHVFIILSGILFLSCRTSDDIKPDDTFILNYEGLPDPNLPGDNLLSKTGVELGRRLFYETRLSEDNSISCASCHEQKHAFADTNRFSTGVKGLKGGRQAMAIFNMAWNTNGFFLGWTG